MSLKSRIGGVSTPEVLDYLSNHPYFPTLIVFIVNFPKSKRFVELNKLRALLNVDKKKSKFVAVLVKPKPNEEILEKIKDLPVDY